MSIDGTVCEYRLTKDEVARQLRRLMLRPPFVVQKAFMFVGGVAALSVGFRWLGCALVLFPLFWLYFLRRIVHTAVAQRPELLELQTLKFGESGFHVSNTVSRLELPWNRVRGVLENPEFVLIRMDTLGSAAIIPKRAFTAEQLQTFLNRARHGAGSR